ncbi:MAG: hypothetical protein RL637_1137 [Pseudomonadota bacterium]|jgi:uncharacterized protein (TIGR00255 family)
MIKSMTAFAGCEAQIDDLMIYAELRSVNHRYCDISFKLPERLRFVEGHLRTMISAQLKRGKIECSFNYKKPIQEGQGWQINSQMVKALLAATTEIETLMPQSRAFSALELLAFPGVQQEKELDKDHLQIGVQALLQRVLTEFLQVREREGQQLACLIEERCHKMLELLALATQRMPLVLQSIRAKLFERVKELIATPDFDRLEQEMVLLAQKLDVAEELERLKTHVIEVKRIIQQEETVGRRLDFLMQEMYREANTLGSKSADREMTQIAIELKVLIEQIREQVQNIE